MSKYYTPEEVSEAREYLKQFDVLHTVLRHVSKSGMSRDISVIGSLNGEVVNLTWHVARALDYKLYSNNTGNWVIRMKGCGMDMGFALVYNLSRAIYETPDNQSDAGYIIKQRWM